MWLDQPRTLPGFLEVLQRMGAMKLEQQVADLGLCKKLKKLGCKQESVFCWCRRIDLPTQYELESKRHIYDLSFQGQEFIAAFTSVELGEILLTQDVVIETNVEVKGELPHHKFDWSVLADERNLPYDDHSDFYVQYATEADARAKMLIYLLEKGI